MAVRYRSIFDPAATEVEINLLRDRAADREASVAG
jgi:hypothetical protein